jgi:hypothetical protein
MRIILGLTQHEDTFVVWPALCLMLGKCASPACNATHFRITFGWLIWTVHWAWSW